MVFFLFFFGGVDLNNIYTYTNKMNSVVYVYNYLYHQL